MCILDGLSTAAKNKVFAYLKETQPAGCDFHIDMLLEARDDSLLSINGLGPSILHKIDNWLSYNGMYRKEEKDFGEWHLIDTAPKDGLRRLLYLSFQGKSPVCGRWVWFPDHTDGYWVHDKLKSAKYNYKCGPHELPQPTHWMPLPEPPNGKN